MPLKRTPWPTSANMHRDGELLRVKDRHDKRTVGAFRDELLDIAERFGIPEHRRESFIEHVTVVLREAAELAASDAAIHMRELVEARVALSEER